MTTSTLDIGDVLSVLGARGIEKQLQRIAGVGSVSINPVSGATTVAYDSGTTSLSAILAAITDCGYHCAGEALPRHVCANPTTPGSVGREPPASPIRPAHFHADMGHAATA